MINDGVFNKKPVYIKDGVYYYDSINAGDNFSLNEVANWYRDGWFDKIYKNGRDLFKEESNKIANIVVDINKPYLEISCGPGMGITPFIKRINSNLHALVSDANPYIIEYWNKYIKENNINNIDFASFDNTNMPIKNNSIDVIVSFLGIGSTKNNGYDDMNCINELYRILKPGGYILTIESYLDDYNKVNELFKKENKYNYYHDSKVIGTIDERIHKAGFEILESYEIGKALATNNDSEIGEIANRYNVKIYWTYRFLYFRKI